MKDTLCRFGDSHLFFRLLFPIPNDIWHTVGSDCNFSTFNPLTEDVCRTFVLASFLIYGVKLLLKIFNALALLFDLAVIFIIDCVHDLLHLELVMHFHLRSSSLATCL